MINQKDSKEDHVALTLQILGLFDNEYPEKDLANIAQGLGVQKSTIQHIVNTMVDYGYLEQTNVEKRYRLGLKLASLGFKVIRQKDLHREALPYMAQLVEEINETCDLCIFDKERVFYLEVLKGNHSLAIAAAAGKWLPAHCTASGKLFLSNLSKKELDAFLSKPLQAYTKYTITSPDELRQQLDIIRKKGYGFDNEELDAGIRAIAAPVRNHKGEIIAAMSIPGPVNRLTDDRITQIIGTLISTTEEISHRMGWKV